MKIIPSLLFTALVTISHACFLLWAKNHQSLPHSTRMKLWQIHLYLNGTLWLVVAGWMVTVQFYLPRYQYPFEAQLLGFLLIIIGLSLVAKARLLLGRSQAMGIRFFFPEKAHRIKSSLYRFLNNPMYDGFILIFIGSGFALGIVENFYFAIASFLLLNIFLASIENFEFKLNPF